MRKTLMTKADTKLLIAIILLSIVAYAIIRYSSVPFTVEGRVIIKTGGEVVQELPLSADTSAQRISIQGRTDPAVIEIEKGRVRVVEAFCPDQVCVKQGWIDTPGASIVCVPNELVIYLSVGTDDGSAAVDAITR
ncbi:MAG: NusG domain II-containing protein [Peptococcia bacterium]|jgi:hypothetical protein